MKDYLSFNLEETEFNEGLFLVMTNTSINNIEDYLDTVDSTTTTADMYMRELSKHSIFTFVPDNRDHTRFALYTFLGVFNCVANDEGNRFLVRTFRRGSLEDQNRALKYGINMSFTDGCHIVFNDTKRDNYFILHDGQEHEKNIAVWIAEQLIKFLVFWLHPVMICPKEKIQNRKLSMKSL